MLKYVTKIVTAWNSGAAVMVVLGAFACAAPANACGTVTVFAGVYLGAENGIADKDVRARCQMQMLGSLLCVDKGYLKYPHAKRLLRAALAHAENSGNPGLKCAAGHVARHFSVTAAVKPDKGKPSLEELVRAEGRVMSFCQPDNLRSDEAAISSLPGPGQKLLECLSR